MARYRKVPQQPTPPHKLVIVNANGKKLVAQHIRRLSGKPAGPPPDKAK